jgi:hypothetical protein
MDERNKAVVDGLTKQKQADQDLADFIAQQALSSTNYQILKINQVVDAQLAAFDRSTGDYQSYAAKVIGLAEEKKQALIRKAQEAAAAEVQAQLDAFNALAAIIPDIGHGPTVPNGGGGPAPITVSPIVLPPVIHQSGIVTNQNTNLSARAGGGPVSAGAPYLVGELGPELFVPQASGAIVPHAALGGGGGTQVIQLVVDGRVLASIVNDHTSRQMRQGRQFPAA